MIILPLTVSSLRQALAEGWATARATRSASLAYAAVFVFLGVIIIGTLLVLGMTPFVIVAAGAFMLLGPAILAGFFGIAEAHEAGRNPRFGAIFDGFRQAAGAVWVLALVCALLFMIFMTDAAILYSYMVGGTAVWLSQMLPDSANVAGFIKWGMLSGFVIALMLFCVSAFSVPLLCERRTGLVNAVMASARIVFANFGPAMLWAGLLSSLMIGSILLLPLLLLTLPWMAFSSRALYRQVLPIN